jgi:hypothetical protein
MALTRWVREVSEAQLMAAAQRTVGQRYGVPPAPAPRGLDIFWQRVYVPVYRRLPWGVRAQVMRRMPGSHQQQWTPRPPSGGPAV